MKLYLASNFREALNQLMKPYSLRALEVVRTKINKLCKYINSSSFISTHSKKDFFFWGGGVNPLTRGSCFGQHRSGESFVIYSPFLQSHTFKRCVKMQGRCHYKSTALKH